ncbi:unnamed protein product [Closterium sp. NIES-54]
MEFSRKCVSPAGMIVRRVMVLLSPSELDVISRSSEIVPDSIVGSQFESFKPTAATVSSSLILGVSSLGEAKFDGAIKSALAYGKCMIAAEENKFSCFLDKVSLAMGKKPRYHGESLLRLCHFWLATDYLVVPLKVMEALKDTPASPDLKPAAVSAAADKVKPWDMARFMANIGPCARQLLQAEIDSAVSQAEKVDKHFKKIWPPPNV